MVLLQLFNFNNKKIEKELKEVSISEKSFSLQIDMITSNYENSLLDEFEKLKDWNITKDKSWGAEEEKEIKEELNAIIKETRNNMVILYNKIKSLENKISNYWSGSTIVITPTKITDSGEKFSPKNDFGVIVKSGDDAADFVVFSSGEIDDIIEVGDVDFFANKNLESDYFTLINLLKNPNFYDEERYEILFTARPKKDEKVFKNGRYIPTGIFLTTSLSDVEGIAADMGDRDIYKIKINHKYLTKTLDRPSLQHYQSFNSSSNRVPIEHIEKLS